MRLWALMLAAGLALSSTSASAQSDGWQIRSDKPGAPSCRAVKFGPAADIHILRNRSNQLVLAAGHPDWSLGTTELTITLTIDGGAPVTLSGLPIDRVVFMLIEDDAVLQRLKRATTLDVTLGERQYRADITGLGTTFDQIAICSG